MDDVIYRQDAVNELREYITEPSISDDESEIIGYNDGIELSISVLSTMPSARKKGKWIRRERTRGGIRQYVGVDEWGEVHTIRVDERIHGYDLYCSECGKLCSDVSLNFCSYCGADMRCDTDG